MPLTVDDIVQVTYRSTCVAQRILFTTSWRVSLAAGSGTELDNLDALAAGFQDGSPGSPMFTYKACLPQNVMIDYVRVQKVYPTRTIYVERAIGDPGAIASDGEATNVCGVITRVSAVAGRDQVSNSHIGPIATANMADGKITVGQATLLASLALRFSQSVSVLAPNQTVEPVIYHRGKLTAPHWADIVDQRVQETIRVMRRRTLFLGE